MQRDRRALDTSQLRLLRNRARSGWTTRNTTEHLDHTADVVVAGLLLLVGQMSLECKLGHVVLTLDAKLDNYTGKAHINTKDVSQLLPDVRSNHSDIIERTRVLAVIKRRIRCVDAALTFRNVGNEILDASLEREHHMLE